MDPNGNIREITPSAPLRSDEISLTEAEAEQAQKMTRAERRKLYRHQAKIQRKELKRTIHG